MTAAMIKQMPSTIEAPRIEAAMFCFWKISACMSPGVESNTKLARSSRLKSARAAGQSSLSDQNAKA